MTSAERVSIGFSGGGMVEVRIDEAPRTGIRGSRVAFLHPAACGGVLTEIVQPAVVHT